MMLLESFSNVVVPGIRNRAQGAVATGERTSFLDSYVKASKHIKGWFSPAAALLFQAYNQVIAHEGISGDVLEIGAYQGLSAIPIASLRGAGRDFFVIDPFTEQISHTSGKLIKDKFLENMKTFYPETDFVHLIEKSSADVKGSELGTDFAFCHIDGDHSASAVYGDLELCLQVLLPGGLVALDDYFNPVYPGVCEGAIRFMLDHKEAYKPIALGLGKVLLQKLPAPYDLNADFAKVFPRIPKTAATLWDTPILRFGPGIFHLFDLARSTPQQLVFIVPKLRADIRPLGRRLQAARGEWIRLPVRVTNRSEIPFEGGDHSSFKLSYHLLSSDQRMLKFDNPRSSFDGPLSPGMQQVVELVIQAPDDAGSYKVEIDLVWEGVTWFKDRGNLTRAVDLIVAYGNNSLVAIAHLLSALSHN